ncbi:unnamed protein product [Mucor hiemalis]
MGVYSSKNKVNSKFQIIDFGSINPLGLYDKCCDEYDLNIVRELILNRKISPFYKGLSNPLEPLPSFDKTVIKKDRKKKRIVIQKKKLNDQENYHYYLISNEKKLYTLLYSNSVECPICFLFYPANINYTRCCDQPICTECFVQIKKGPGDYNTSSSSSTSHIDCPYCMTEEFGIVYSTPSTLLLTNKEKHNIQIISTTSGVSDIQRSKRKSIESSHPDVVLIDHVRSQQSDSNMSNNESGMTGRDRANSLQFWFQSRPNATSLERYFASIRLDTLSAQDILVIESIRRSIIEREQERLLMY